MYHLKSNAVISLNSKRYFTCDYFGLKKRGLKIDNMANMGPLTRDIFCAINAQVKK